jgi:hypothetical protein
MNKIKHTHKAAIFTIFITLKYIQQICLEFLHPLILLPLCQFRLLVITQYLKPKPVSLTTRAQARLLHKITVRNSELLFLN